MNRLAIYSETLDPRSPTSELVHRSRDYPLKNFMAAFDYETVAVWLRHWHDFSWRTICFAILPCSPARRGVEKRVWSASRGNGHSRLDLVDIHERRRPMSFPGGKSSLGSEAPRGSPSLS